MDVNKLMLSRMFESNERLEAPLFQRPYVWNKSKNWVALWESIEALANKRLSGGSVRPHFLGTIVLDQLRTSPGRVHARQIIDGQQRLTTLQLALAAARDLAKQYGFNKHEHAFRNFTENSVPLSTCDEDIFKVWPTNADRTDFRDVMTAGSREAVKMLPHAALQDEWLIPNAYIFFWDKYTDLLGDPARPDFSTRLDALYHTFIEGLQVVVINLEAQDDAQEIFETLNALGTPLLPADLVKNYLFHEAIEQNRIPQEFYDKYWNAFDAKRDYWRKEIRQGRIKRPRLDLFLYHYLTLMHGEVILDTQVFGSFKEFFCTNFDSCASKHMECFRTYADIYRGFEFYPRNSREELFFYRLQQMDISTLHPFMLEICKRYASNADQPKRLQIMKDIESFLIRRMICQLSNKNYNRFFTELINRLRQSNDFSPDTIRSILASETAETSLWPTDEMFRLAWLNIAFYKRIKASRTRMILEAIERSIYTDKSEKIEFDRSLTLEHLMPQEADLKHWPLVCDPDDHFAVAEAGNRRRELIHGIGNLTLLTQKLNSSISNGPWKKKAHEILLHSRLNLNLLFKDVDTWTNDSIRLRAESLFSYAIKVWPRPLTDITPDNMIHLVKQRKQEGDRKTLRLAFWTGLLDYAKSRTTIHANRKPHKYNWVGGGIGRSGFHLNYVVREYESQVELSIDLKSEATNKAVFNSLRKDLQTIEAEYGSSLEWHELPDARSCRICKVVPGGWRSPSDTWPDIHAYLTNAMISLDAAFRPRIHSLSL